MTEFPGRIDLHVHAAPDVRARVWDDIELARAARAAGYRAILLKNHHTSTADRAAIAARVVGGVEVFGGLVLNAPVGGINPHAVEFALKLGARQIWFPTISARVERAARGAPTSAREPVTVLDRDGEVTTETREVLALIRDHRAILGTGHLDLVETRAVLGEARRLGVERLLVTHPEHPLLEFGLEDQRAFAAMGASFERCFCFTVGAIPNRPVALAAIATATREIGLASTILSTDLGRADLPDPVTGFDRYLTGLRALGFSPAELGQLCGDNAARLLGI